MVFRKKRVFKRRPRKVVPRKKTTFAKRVLKVVQRKAEHKVLVSSTSNYMVNYNAGTPLQICLTPNASTLTCVQGNGQSDRIGNKISISKVMIRGMMYPMNYSAIYNSTPQPHEIRMIISRNKSTPLAAPSMTGFFQTGNSSQAPVGNLQDMVLQVNQDLQTCYANKYFKLGNSEYAPSGGGGSPGTQYFANNDYKLNCKFAINVTKYCPKVIEWNDTTATPISPSTWVTFLTASAVNASIVDIQECAVYYQVEITYTDL